MKLQKLIEELEKKKTQYGDIEVTIHCDQELSADGNPEDTEISTILWEPAPIRLMLCDSHTFSELSN